MVSVLSACGWDAGFEESFREFREHGLLPARVIGSSRQVYKLQRGDSEVYGRRINGRARTVNWNLKA